VSEKAKWTVVDCWVGPECWCSIIVDPDGVERIDDGSIRRETCYFIVDALNQKPGAETNRHPDFPLPWYVHWIDGGFAMALSAKGIQCEPESIEIMNHIPISAARLCDNESIQLFVKTVNEFYGAKENG
jgi:hypothetical protein